jgi:uncharacterized delta-60 repeat protein
LKKSLLLLLVACALVLVQAGLAGAAPRAGLDRSYGSQGIADIGSQAGGAATEAWAAFGDGATVVLRSRWECGQPRCTRSLTMQHYASNGEFDQSFGAGSGAVTIAQRLTTPIRSGLAVDPEGRILASWGTTGIAVVTRFNADGSLDPSFGAGGSVSLPCPCGEGEGSAGVVLLPGGKVLLHRIGRNPQDPGVDALTLWRLLPDGALDPSFAGGAPEGASIDFHYGAAPRFFAAAPNGSLLLAGGPGCCEENRHAYLYRVSGKGKLVHGFMANAAHSLQALPDFGEAAISSLIVRGSGRIDLLGSKAVGGGGYLFRLRADGRRDRGFGKRGLNQLAWPIVTAAGDSGGGTLVVDQDTVRGALVVHRLFPNGRVDRRLGGALGAAAFGVPILNGLEAVTTPRGRALVFVGGTPECRYGNCEQKPRLAMFQEPPLRKRG